MLTATSLRSPITTNTLERITRYTQKICRIFSNDFGRLISIHDLDSTLLGSTALKATARITTPPFLGPWHVHVVLQIDFEDRPQEVYVVQLVTWSSERGHSTPNQLVKYTQAYLSLLQPRISAATFSKAKLTDLIRVSKAATLSLRA